MASIARVRERAEEQSSSLSLDQQNAIRMLANDLHRLNHSVMKAVEAGVSVELVRSARHHGGDGNWGDLLLPVVMARSRQRLRIKSRHRPPTRILPQQKREPPWGRRVGNVHNREPIPSRKQSRNQKICFSNRVV